MTFISFIAGKQQDVRKPTDCKIGNSPSNQTETTKEQSNTDGEHSYYDYSTYI